MALEQGLRQEELRLWRMFGGSPDQENAMRQNDNLLQRAHMDRMSAERANPPPLVLTQGPGGHGIAARP